MLDFRSRKKKTLPVTFADGSTLNLKVPTKALYEQLSAVKASAGYDELADLCAEILSTNAEGRQVEASKVVEMFDIADISYLVQEYAKFVKEVVSNPN